MPLCDDLYICLLELKTRKILKEGTGRKTLNDQYFSFTYHLSINPNYLSIHPSIYLFSLQIPSSFLITFICIPDYNSICLNLHTCNSFMYHFYVIIFSMSNRTQQMETIKLWGKWMNWMLSHAFVLPSNNLHYNLENCF